MDRASGEILSISADTATVSVVASGCPRCAAGKGCGAGLLASSEGSTQVDIQLSPGHFYRTGDAVTLTIASSSLLRAALLAYGLPLAGIVLALTTGWLVMATLSDFAAAMIALAGLLGGFFLGRRQLQKKAWCKQFALSIDPQADGSTARI